MGACGVELARRPTWDIPSRSGPVRTARGIVPDPRQEELWCETSQTHFMLNPRIRPPDPRRSQADRGRHGKAETGRPPPRLQMPWNLESPRHCRTLASRHLSLDETSTSGRTTPTQCGKFASRTPAMSACVTVRSNAQDVHESSPAAARWQWVCMFV